MYKTDPDSIFIKHKKTGRPRILRDEHKQVILEYIDENPSVILEQVRKWECTDMDFTCRYTNLYCRPVMAAPDRYRLWNRDVAACLNCMHILRELRRNDTVPVAPTRRRRRVDDQEQPRTRIRIDSFPS
ncbi:hypothetical protein G6F68_008811 [Rhizopus microsporus]|nr:hypothetical protein G6F68_008811 [Rhizopus microsporus]